MTGGQGVPISCELERGGYAWAEKGLVSHIVALDPSGRKNWVSPAPQHLLPGSQGGKKAKHSAEAGGGCRGRGRDG